MASFVHDLKLDNSHTFKSSGRRSRIPLFTRDVDSLQTGAVFIQTLTMRGIFISVYLWVMIALVTLIAFFVLVGAQILLAPFDHKRSVAHWVTWGWARTLFLLNPLWTLRISGADRLDRKNPCIIAANHQSVGDVVALCAIGVPFRWISKKSMFYLPILGWGAFFAGHIPVDRADKESRARCIRLAKSWLYRGVSVCMFPEGTRSLDGRVHGFQDGAFRMSVETGFPVVPIAIDGTARALPGGSLKFGKPTDIHIAVGDIIRPPIQVADAHSAPKEVEAMRETARKWIIREIARIRDTSIAAVDAPGLARRRSEAHNKTVSP